MNPKSDKESPSGSLIAYMSGLAKSQGGINLAQGIPGFTPPAGLLQKLEELVYLPVHQYPAGNGDPNLIIEIQKFYTPLQAIDSQQILVVQGATEGISLVYLYLHLKFGQGFSCLAFDPIYESYSRLPDLYGDQLFRMSFNEDGEIDWDTLERLIIKQGIKLIFVNSPGNPFGRIWTQVEFERLKTLADIYDFYILFDGVYSELYFTKEKPFCSLTGNLDRLFFVNSFSKMFSITGWRVGYLITSEKHLRKINDIHDYTGLCTPSILQKALAGYMKDEVLGSVYSDELRKKLKISLDLLSGPLKELGFLFVKPSAGYFIWAKLPEPFENGLDFCLELFHQQKVAMVPGVHFSFQGQAHVRINFAREPIELYEALKGIQSFLIP